jgi:hypothetical protein
MKLSEHISDAVAFARDVVTMSALTVGSAIAIFAKLQPAIDIDPHECGTDCTPDNCDAAHRREFGYEPDPGDAWDRGRDRNIDRANGVI